MKRALVIFGGWVGALLALGASPEPDAWKLPAGEPKLKAGAGSELASTQCVLCHSVDYIITQPLLTREQWKGNVIKMQQKFGATVSAEKLDPLLDYLVKNYGK